LAEYHVVNRKKLLNHQLQWPSFVQDMENGFAQKSLHHRKSTGLAKISGQILTLFGKAFERFQTNQERRA